MTLLDPGQGVRRLGVGLAEHGGRLAIVGPDRRLTYAELGDMVEDVGARLGPEPRLVLAPMRPSIDAVVGYLGSLAAGHPVLVTEDDPARIASLIDRFDPDVVLRPTSTGVELEERRTLSAHDLHPDLALLLPTSGSTGAPRLVRLSNANVLANATAIADYLRITADDRAITSLPLHYCYGLSVLHSHLLQGAGIVLTDLSVVDACFWAAFREHDVTNLAGVPHTFQLLDRIGFDELHLPALRLVTQAGGRLAPDHVRRLAEQGDRDGWDFIVMYGQTEATARMAYLPAHLAAEHPSTIGIPIPGGAIRLEPLDGSAPEEGELVYTGPNVMLGYAESPEDLALGATIAELRTGDVARRTRDGLYEIVGRRSRFGKVCGLRLDLDQIEARLSQAGIEALCASDDSRISVAITDAHRADDAATIVRRVTRLPSSRVAVATVATLPRLPNGKPDHPRVLELLPLRDAPVVASTAADAVRQVFQRVLDVDGIADTDTFASLGGDSLSYVEASILLEERLGELPPNWPSVAVAQLTPYRRPSRWWSRTETTVVVRAVSIVLIVGTHIKLWAVLGGAHVLLALAGYSFGRFQNKTSGRLRSIARIALPSVLWLAIATQLNPRIRWEHVLQVNGWIGSRTAHGGYWFVEALLQIVLLLTVVLAIPAVARAEQAHPLRVAASALAFGLLVRFHAIDLPVTGPHDIRPHDIFWIFAIGWAAAHVTTLGPRIALSVVVVAATPQYFGEPAREVLLVIALLVVLWAPTVPVPRTLTRPIGAIAGASLYIYLCHWQVFPPLRRSFSPEVALIGSLVAGVLLWHLARRIERVSRGWSTRRAEPAQPAPS